MQDHSRSQARAALCLALAEAQTHPVQTTHMPMRVREERDWLAKLLARMGIEAWCSPADTVLAHFPDPDRMEQALRDQGLQVGRHSGRPELSDWLILRVPGRSQAFEKLCQTLVDLIN